MVQGRVLAPHTDDQTYLTITHGSLFLGAENYCLVMYGIMSLQPGQLLFPFLGIFWCFLSFC